MAIPSPADDKKQIGLTLAGSKALARLMAEGLFAIEGDAYKFGIAYAVAMGIDPGDAPDSGYATKFNATGGLDREGLVRDLLSVLNIGDATRPYATAERLAEVGLAALVKRIEAHESLAEILQELGQGSDDLNEADEEHKIQG
jgi:hypothetical protein